MRSFPIVAVGDSAAFGLDENSVHVEKTKLTNHNLRGLNVMDGVCLGLM